MHQIVPGMDTSPLMMIRDPFTVQDALKPAMGGGESPEHASPNAIGEFEVGGGVVGVGVGVGAGVGAGVGLGYGVMNVQLSCSTSFVDAMPVEAVKPTHTEVLATTSVMSTLPVRLAICCP